MPTILLEQIIELLTGWKNSFFSWANEIGDKIASIKTNTDSLPDIESNTDDIKDNTAAVITPISNINSNVTTISSDVSTIKTDTGIIKNNASAIATSSGQAAAFAEDVANNTLEVKNKITTIASDTTQMRADSGSIRSDVSEIKNTLGLYLYNTIVTEDAEGPIANFDTDLKDYLQNAVVTIPADAGGISGLYVFNQNTNDNILMEYFKGLWNGSYGFARLDTLVWSSIVGNRWQNNTYSSSIKIPVSNNTPAEIIYSEYPTYSNQYLYDNNVNGVAVSATGDIRIRNGSTIDSPTGYIIFKLETPATPTITISEFEAICSAFGYSLNDYSVSFTTPITDGAEVDLLSGIVKINTSPVTYDSITPLAIRTFKGVNNIYSDIGDMSVTYRETLKHYLEKQQ